MAMVSLGDLARSFMLQRHSLDAKKSLDTLAGELASGRHADLSARLKGDFTALSQTEGVLGRLAAQQVASNGLAVRLGAQQAALGALDGIGKSVSDTLLRAGESVATDILDLAASNAEEHLSSALGILNTRSAGQSVFAGTRVDGEAVPPLEEFLAAVLPQVGGATSAGEVMAAVSAWFEDPGGFSQVAYRGGPARAAITVGPGETLSDGPSADHPALRGLLAGLTAAALMSRGVLQDQTEAKRELATLAAEALTGNADARVHLAASVGLSEARLDQIQARNQAEEVALGLSRADMVNKDPVLTASELDMARTQLELLHAMTARLSGLSLLGALK